MKEFHDICFLVPITWTCIWEWTRDNKIDPGCGRNTFNNYLATKLRKISVDLLLCFEWVFIPEQSNKDLLALSVSTAQKNRTIQSRTQQSPFKLRGWLYVISHFAPPRHPAFGAKPNCFSSHTLPAVVVCMALQFRRNLHFLQLTRASYCIREACKSWHRTHNCGPQLADPFSQCFWTCRKCNILGQSACTTSQEYKYGALLLGAWDLVLRKTYCGVHLQVGKGSW